MKSKVKYWLAKFVVLVVALHTIDVSIDIDHLTASTSARLGDAYDDIDSFSEYIVETIFDDHSLFSEGDHEDQHPGHKNIHKLLQSTFYVKGAESLVIDMAVFQTRSERPALRNTLINLEHYSPVLNPPPDLAACS